MIASGLVANGTKVYIAARKEDQLKNVSCHLVVRGRVVNSLGPLLGPRMNLTRQDLADAK